MKAWVQKQKGFTIVELLIVIVVIAILAAITVVAYNGVQDRARAARVQSDINQVHKLINIYYAKNGTYPVTDVATISGHTTASVAYTDTGCSVGSSRTDWVPALDQTLPQSDHNTGKGVAGTGGCYMYQSDGTSYILSAWNMLKSPQTSTMYRRIGFREIPNVPFYYCNHANIGGNNPTPYTVAKDYYKHSYTISNITFCNESPPNGA